MTLSSLYLAPTDPQLKPALHDIRRVLKELQIIGPPLAAAGFSAGEGFSRHVIYTGCAPHLVMQPPADGSLQFCHVVLHGPFARPHLVTGPNTVPPRCPACRTRLQDWRDQRQAWDDDRPARCAACGHSCAPSALDWRGHAITGCVLVELRNVFPAEAAPSDLLMQHLREATGSAWRYAWAAYLRD
jgi:hypothetical protein